MTMIALRGAIEIGLIYGLVALALYISYRTLDIADLTVDGTFALGAATTAVCTVAGHPVLGLFAAMGAGVLAGFVTAILQTKLKVQSILAGIITMTALYSINIIVMGNRSNLPMAKNDTLFTLSPEFAGDYTRLIVIAAVIALVCVITVLFFRTPLGLSVRATGDNRDMVSASSINPAFTTTVGLCAANAVVGLAGALFAQYQKVGDSTSGTGTVVIGLASLIIGEVLLGRRSVVRGVIGAIVGAIIYRIIIAAALSASISASNLKLVSAIIVAVAISYPAIKEQLDLHKMRKAAKVK